MPKKEPHIEWVNLDPPPEAFYNPPSKWGEIAFYADPAPWISTRILRCPEGLFMTVACLTCGGRQEVLFDARPSMEAPDGVLRHTKMVESFIGAESTAEWVERHKRCDTAPATFEVPEIVMPFVGVLTGHADRALRFGNEVGHTMYYVCDDHTAFAVPFYEHGVSDKDRARNIWLKKFIAREFMRGHGLTPTACVIVTEVWMAQETVSDDVKGMSQTEAMIEMDGKGQQPSARPDRQEKVMCMVVTPEFSYMGLAPIIRDGGKIGEGRGRLGSLTMDFHHLYGRVADGCLALTSAAPPTITYKWTQAKGSR